MFNPVGSRVSFPQLEEKVLAFWKEKDVFKRSVAARKGGPRFVLYDGPPTVNGSPALHHVFTSVFKDVIPRYKVMKGYYAPRIGGWDTHGLPVELEVEEQIGISSKTQIEEYGIARFNDLCRQSVNRYLHEFEEIIERAGYWVDLENAYVTMRNEYIESCWWAIKRMWDKGLVYQGYRVTPHCPRCGTSLSSHEVAQGYKDNTEDPSVYIKFKTMLSKGGIDEVSKKMFNLALEKGSSLKDTKTFFLAWTTTPWTLPGNTALAVNPEADYVIIEMDGEYLIIADALRVKIGLDELEPKLKVKGSDLIKIEYEPLYNPHEYETDRLMIKESYNNETNTRHRVYEKQESPKPNPLTGEGLSYKVIGADFVSLEDGTGIVHIAPAFGEDDFRVMHDDPDMNFVQQVDLQGKITGTYPFAGKFVKDADPEILDDLNARGLLLKSEKIHHAYPFCWRCEAPLLYYAKTTWYIKTTALKDRLISGNDEMNWYPEHIKYGRFGDWLQNNIDWAFSRERYWGTPLPVWNCEKCGSFECVGSVAELQKKERFSGFKEPLDLHRPFVDELTFACPKCGGRMQRVPEVIDCWFDSGAMPIAQSHYPFENQTLLEDGRFPADFICEAVDQTRGWFYSLHAISMLLFNQPCFKNVICLGHILDAKGEKMSKRKGNVVWPREVIDRYGADTLRWYLYTASAPGNPRQFDDKKLDEISRSFFSTLWNVYSFFVMYANIDKYTPNAEAFPLPEAELDRWILSELNQLIVDVIAALDQYNPTEGGRKIESFVDGLSNWYVRRSRRRFWKSENDADKLSAYNTLYACLVALVKLMAPFTPFLAEELYQNLVRTAFPEAPESVHLADYPSPDKSKIDKQLADDNRLAMNVCSLGRAARSKAGIKIRQPLETLYIGVSSEWEKRALERLRLLVLEELNVKEILYESVDRVAGLEMSGFAVVSETNSSVAISTHITVELEAEGFAREIVHRVQTMRRNAGYEIVDHIILYYEGAAHFVQSISAFADYIRQETLSDEIEEGIAEDADLQDTFKIGGASLKLGVKKAG